MPAKLISKPQMKLVFTDTGRVDLSLTVVQAAALYALLRNVGGSSEETVRGVYDEIASDLRVALPNSGAGFTINANSMYVRTTKAEMEEQVREAFENEFDE